MWRKLRGASDKPPALVTATHVWFFCLLDFVEGQFLPAK